MTSCSSDRKSDNGDRGTGVLTLNHPSPCDNSGACGCTAIGCHRQHCLGNLRDPCKAVQGIGENLPSHSNVGRPECRDCCLTAGMAIVTWMRCGEALGHGSQGSGTAAGVSNLRATAAASSATAAATSPRPTPAGIGCMDRQARWKELGRHLEPWSTELRGCRRSSVRASPTSPGSTESRSGTGPARARQAVATPHDGAPPPRRGSVVSSALTQPL